MPSASGIVLIGSSFQWLIGPTLFFTIVATTTKNFELKYGHLLHLLPFVLHLGFIITQFHIYGYEVKYNLLKNGFPYFTPWARLMSCGNYIQFAVYGIISLKVLSGVREEMVLTTSQSVERNIFYFKFLVYDFIIAWGINTISMFINFGSTGYPLLWIATVLNIFFIANAMVFQGLRFPEIYHEESTLKTKYEKNLLPNKERTEYAQQLQEYMQVQKPYLNPMLSLSDLASQLAVPSYTLSQVLNQELKQNFYDFVNYYRLEESKKLLTDSAPKDSKILEVGFKSGFNSKSVFNSAFKKHTGMTPREFRKYLHERKSTISATIS
jgi:AraC-like DNA-binding protein